MEKNRVKYFNILKDFTNDLLTTFPEYNDLIHKNIHYICKEWNGEYDTITKGMDELYEFSLERIPVCFFDILYKNEELYEEKTEKDTEFIKGIDFKLLWNENISERTKEIIWKYLQLFVFALVGDIENNDVFGETSKLFEAINEDTFKEKLESTINEFDSFFSNIGDEKGGDEKGGDDEYMKDMHEKMKGMFNEENIPKAGDIHDHIQSMMNGNIGNLAKEIAEDTFQDLNISMDDLEGKNGGDPNVLFKTLFKNPSKLLGLTKSIGSKLDEKMKSGEINQDELMKEATDMMSKMKSMPGMENMNDLFKNFAGSMGGGMKGKMNMKASQNNFEKYMKKNEMRDRMKEKLNQRRQVMNIQNSVPKDMIGIVNDRNNTNDRNDKNNTDGNVKKKKKKKKNNK
jgi:hypothetical protein